MRLTIVWLMMMCAAVVLVGCGASNPMSPSAKRVALDPNPQESSVAFGRALHEEADSKLASRGDVDLEPPPPGGSPGPVSSTTKQQATPLLIYSATLHMAVFEATQTLDATQKLAEKLGGYLVRRGDRSITVRVPSKKFRGVLSTIAKLGDVLHRDESVEDVTEKFYDLRTRLTNARAMRARLEQLLQQAANVKEALMVEKELARVTTDIEVMEGKLKLMGELIRFSTITLQLKPRPVDKIDSKVKLPFPWLDQLGLPHLLNL